MRKIVYIVFLALVLAACNDYRVEDGKLYYHSWSALDGWYTVQVEGVEPPHFDYAKDASHVYFRDSIIADADPNTFAVVVASDSIHGWVVFDKYRIYSGGECSTVNQWRQEHFYQ